jgi:hypothetical protein
MVNKQSPCPGGPYILLRETNNKYQSHNLVISAVENKNQKKTKRTKKTEIFSIVVGRLI